MESLYVSLTGAVLAEDSFPGNKDIQAMFYAQFERLGLEGPPKPPSR